MIVYIDADGCPTDVRVIITKAAARRKFKVIMVANRSLAPVKSKLVTSVVVPAGMDVADAWIAERAGDGDLVITNDIPLAAEVAEKGAEVLTHRGDLLDAGSVGERLAMRDFFTEARESGMIQGGGPPPFDAKARKAFANAFDRWITAALKRRA